MSEPGNLYASLLVIPAAERAVAAQLPLVAGVALVDGLEAVCGPPLAGRVTIKWPNDVLVDGAKVAGILAESRTIGDRLAVVVGFGVNCGHAPALGAYATMSLAEAGRPVSPDTLWAGLADAMAGRLAQWANGTGFGEIREAWLARTAGLGRPVSVRLGHDTVTGRFDGIDNDGRLVLNGPDGEVRIAAGDVYFADADQRGGDT